MATEKEIPESEHPGYEVEGNDTSGYVGVSPEYATYANESEKPLVAEDDEGVEKKAVLNAQRAAKRSVVELNAYGLPAANGDSPFKSAVDEDGEPIDFTDKSDDDKDDDKPKAAAAPKKAATSSTTPKPATEK